MDRRPPANCVQSARPLDSRAGRLSPTQVEQRAVRYLALLSLYLGTGKQAIHRAFQGLAQRKGKEITLRYHYYTLLYPLVVCFCVGTLSLAKQKQRRDNELGYKNQQTLEMKTAFFGRANR